ncbi:MAG: serine hydrolase [Bacteroidales bacterium]|nr:serine hydrolase [Bacteroidales bacterium]
MRRKRTISAIVLAAIVAVGCSTLETDKMAEVVAEEVSAPFELILKGNSYPETKTAFGQPEGSKMPLVWTAVDRLGLFVSKDGVEACGNVPATIVKGKGQGQNTGIFRATLEGLSVNSTYDISLYYPYFLRGGNESGIVLDRVAPDQVQERSGSSAHIGKSGGFAVAKTQVITPGSNQPFTAEVNFDLVHKTSYMWFSITAADGNYTGWSIKRIRMIAPDGTWLAGDTKYNPDTEEFTLVDDSALSNAVSLDIVQSNPLSTTAQDAFMVIFPTSAAGKTLQFEYTLQNPAGTRTVTLTHERGLSATSTLFAPGKLYTISEQIPASAGSGWTEEEVQVDLEYYRQKLEWIVKACDLPSLQINYTDNVKTISLAICNDDWYAANGKISYLNQSDPISPASIYQACSVSKVPFSYIVCKMADDGEIDFDTPIVDYFPGILDWFASDDETQRRAKLVTPRMIMSHTSGLDNSNYSNSEFLFEPGEKLNYSGVGMSMLQKTVEHIKGSTMDVISKDYIFDRLGMTHSNYLWQSEYTQLHVWGFSGTNYSTNARNNNWSGGKCNVAYSLRTNADEYTKFLQWILRGADLSKEMYDQMFTPQIATANPNTYRTLGWVGYDGEEYGWIYLHTGNNVSFKSNSLIVPEKNASLCYFFNGPSTYSLHGDIIKLFFGNTLPMANYGEGNVPAEHNEEGGAGSGSVYDE